MQIYLVENGKSVGPFELDDVRQRLQDGELKRSDLAWYEGLADWIPLSDVPGMEQAPPPPPPPARPSAVSAPRAPRRRSEDLEFPEEEEKKKLPWWALALVIGIMFVLMLVVGLVAYFKMNHGAGVADPGSSSSEEMSSSSFPFSSMSMSSSGEMVSSAGAQVLTSTLNGKISMAVRSAPEWMKNLASSDLLDDGQKEKLPSRRYHFVDLNGDGTNEALVFATGLDPEDGNQYTQIVGVYSAQGGQYHMVDRLVIGGQGNMLVKTDTVYPRQNTLVLRSFEYGPADSTGNKANIPSQVAFRFAGDRLELTSAAKLPAPAKAAPKAAAPKALSSAAKPMSSSAAKAPAKVTKVD